MSDAHDRAAEALEEVADALREARLAFEVAEDLTRATVKSGSRGVPVLLYYGQTPLSKDDDQLTTLSLNSSELVTRYWWQSLQWLSRTV
jgi:hypothetical protein